MSEPALKRAKVEDVDYIDWMSVYEHAIHEKNIKLEILSLMLEWATN